MPDSLPSSAALPRNLAGLDLAGLFAAASSGEAETDIHKEVLTAEELSLLLPAFEVEFLIGAGGMGAVYRARHKTLDRRVALKVLPPEISADAALAERFRREAQTLARLQHPNIVSLLEFGVSGGGHLFFTMELLEGGDLAARLRSGNIEPAEALRWLREICAALEYAHGQGVIHRDIKPSNILLTTDGHVKVADFGLAVLQQRGATPKLTKSGVAVGTLEYASPEQLAGDADKVDARSDVYSLGVLAYEILTGALPRGVFDPPSASGRVEAIYDDVVLRAMANDPARRYASAAAFRAALERPVRDAAKLRRRNQLAAAFAGLSLLAVGAAAWALVKSREADAAAQRAAANERTAEVSREEAEKLVDFMMTDLQAKLRDIHQLGFLGNVVAKVDAYYAQAPARDDDVAFLGRKAQFYEAKGIVERVRGQTAACAASFAEARRLLGRLQCLQPLEIRWLRRDLEVVAQSESGGLHSDAQIAAAEPIIHKMEQHWPQEVATLQERMRQHERIARQKKREKDAAAALRSLDQSDAILRRLIDLEGDAWSNYDAWGLHKLTRAEYLLNDNQPEAAVAAARQGLEVFTARLAVQPQFTHWEGRVAHASYVCAWTLDKTGQSAEALSHIRRAVDLTEKLAARSPDNLESRRDFTLQLEQWQSIAQKAGAKEDAEAAREKLANIPATLAARAGHSSVNAAAAPQDEASRRKSVEELFATLEQPGAVEPAFEAWTKASESFGQWLQFQQREADALAHYESWRDRLETKASAAEPGSPWHLALSYTLNRIGVIHETRGDFTAALIPYQAALAARLGVFQRDPAKERAQRDIVSSHVHVLECQIGTQDGPGALKACHALLDLLQPHASKLRAEATYIQILTSGVEKSLAATANDASMAESRTSLRDKALAVLKAISPDGKGLNSKSTAAMNKWERGEW